jgi:DNA gyrase subunit A
VGEYRLQRRGGSGVINIKTTERNGNVVGMKAVCDTDDVMFISQQGILMRTRVQEIRETGRNAQGVRLIKLDEGDLLVAMAKVDAEEAENGGGEDKGAAPTGEAPTGDAPASPPPDTAPPTPEAGDTTPPAE